METTSYSNTPGKASGCSQYGWAYCQITGMYSHADWISSMQPLPQRSSNRMERSMSAEWSIIPSCRKAPQTAARWGEIGGSGAPACVGCSVGVWLVVMACSLTAKSPAGFPVGLDWWGGLNVRCEILR